ncbi:MAG: ATP-binding protein [Sulfuricellaceae bacterium]|nr:ATP-binding protein [Sulfuricellaceae bacterium]
MTPATSPLWRTLIEQCQQALYQSSDETLFRDALCQSMVASGAYAAAWIGFSAWVGADQARYIHIVAQSGLAPLYCGDHAWTEDAADSHPLSLALRTGASSQAHYAEDAPDLPGLLPPPGKEHEGIYFLAVPFQLYGRTAGVLGLCAREQSAFDEDARAWLALVVQTLTFGLMEQRRRVEEVQEAGFYRVTVDRLMQQILAVDHHAIISIADQAGVILYANDKFFEVSQYSYDELVGSKHSIVNSGCHPPEFFAQMWKTISSGAVWYGEVCNRRKNGEEYWVDTTIVPFPSPDGKGWHYVSVRTEITALKRYEKSLLQANEQLEQRVTERTQELEMANEALEIDIQARTEIEEKLRQKQEEQQKLIEELKNTQHQLLQSEKMASIGQLAAGVAHEINNPIGYVHSNLGSLEKYMDDLFSVLSVFEAAESDFPPHSAALARINAYKETLDLSFLKEDIPTLIAESKEGITRVKKIVQDLKDFSHVDEAEWQLCDLHRGMDSTLNIVWNELKYKVEVVKEYGALPEIECIPSQLNQVFMNLLVNAGHAIEDRGTITIRTGQEEDQVWVEIADTGKGIAEEHLKRIFEPFFTTKPVGKGTGLGLSLSYGIVTNHHGRILVESIPGAGTTFRICLPVKQLEKAQ